MRKLSNSLKSFARKTWVAWVVFLPFVSLANEKSVVDISIATIPEEFRCEALKNNDFDQVNQSMAALKKAINEPFGLNSDCVTSNLEKPENQKILNALLETLKEGISTISDQLADQYTESITGLNKATLTPHQAYLLTLMEQEKARQAVTEVVETLNEVNTMVARNSLNIHSSRNCNSHYSKSERIIFGVAEMVEDISPLLVQAVATIPGLQEFAPAIIGASMVSSAVTQYAQVAQKRVDINKQENRTSILVNTCQLVKTYGKMRLLQGLVANPEKEKNKLNQTIKEEKEQLNRIRAGDSRNLRILDESKWISAVDQQNKNFIKFSEIRDSVQTGTDEQVCNLKGPISDLSNQIISTNNRLLELSSLPKSSLDFVFQEQVNQFQSDLEKEGQSLSSCAQKTKELYSYLSTFNRRSFQILMDFKRTRIASKKDYNRTSQNINFLKSFQEVIQKMNTDELFNKLQVSINKTDAMLKQADVLKAWFGNAKNFYLPGFDTYRNPIMDLMNYYERQFLVLRDHFAKGASQFDQNLYELFKYWHPRKKDQTDRNYFAEFEKIQMNLKILNPTYLDSKNVATTSGRSSPHEKACTSMISLRDGYKTMIVAWDTLKYICQMMRPLLLEPQVSNALKERCLGVNDLVPNSPRVRLSRVDALLELVSVDVKRMPIIDQKINELKCE
ncbi:MAG: hypothetical protein ACAH59_08310 [Pseudobdellovibrionaceae bacterium]